MFRETDRAPAPYDGHHVQVYVADFSGPYRKLLDKGLITEESDQHQYRFKDLADPESGATLFTIEHEVRSMRHPLFNASARQSQSVAEQHELCAGLRRVDSRDAARVIPEQAMNQLHSEREQRFIDLAGELADDFAHARRAPRRRRIVPV